MRYNAGCTLAHRAPVRTTHVFDGFVTENLPKMQHPVLGINHFDLRVTYSSDTVTGNAICSV